MLQGPCLKLGLGLFRIRLAQIKTYRVGLHTLFNSTMAPEPDVFSLSNPLATVEQLSSSSSQLDGVPADLESSLRFAGAQLTQAAGILLRLPQEIIAQAIVLFYRFYVGSEGGSFRINALKVP